MTLDQMRYFLEAAKFEHVGKAAKSVAISPSAISSAISALEKKLECQLFEKQGKNIRLTESGRLLKTKLEKIFDDLALVESDLNRNRSTMVGTFRIGASPFLATRFLSPAWFKMQKVHPGVIGEFSSMHTSRLLLDVLSGNVDLALCFSPLRHPDLVIHELGGGQLRIAVRKGHPLAKKRGPLSAISEFPATLHKATSGVDICENHPAFDMHGIVPKVACFFDTDEIAVQSLVSSDSWSLLPEVVIEANSDQIVAIAHPKEWDAPYTIATVARSHRDSNAVLKEFRLFLKTELKLR